MKKTIGIVFFCLSLPAFAATSPQLVFPVACELGKTCYFSTYATDTSNTTPANTPNTKNSPTKDDSANKNRGTDIAIATYQQMNTGVNVLAADAGKVSRIRNDQDDHTQRGLPYDPKKACGNGIIIEHSKGWQTQYCHLKKGSITVKPGDKVQAGQVIAQIGASGHADYPHLHFTVRRYDSIVEPFSSHLWKDNIQLPANLGLIDWGMTDKALKLQDVLDQPPRRAQFSLFDSAFIVWIRAYGVQNGDQQRVSFYQPNGQIYQKPIETTIPGNFNEWFAFAGYPLGEKIPADLTGKWHVVYQIKRGNTDWQTLGNMEFTVSS